MEKAPIEVQASAEDHSVEIEKHLKAAKLADQSAKHHREAAKALETGDTAKAGEHAAIATSHIILPTINPNFDPTQHAAM